MSQVFEVLHHARVLGSSPLAVVVAAALLAALIEQRMARRHTPDFTAAFRDAKGPVQDHPPQPRTRPKER